MLFQEMAILLSWLCLTELPYAKSPDVVLIIADIQNGADYSDPERGGRHGDEGLSVGREGLHLSFHFIEGPVETPEYFWIAVHPRHRRPIETAAESHNPVVYPGPPEEEVS